MCYYLIKYYNKVISNKYSTAMKSKGSKRQKLRKALKSTGRRVRDFTRSRIVKRFIPLFGLIAIFTSSGPAQALTIDPESLNGLGSYGKNGTFFAIGFEGSRRVVKHGVSAIPEPTVRATVSTVGSIGAMIAGVACGLGTVGCSAMGWEQKAVLCAQGLGVCAGVATGMHEADPGNPATIPGKLAGDAASAALRGSA